jgi:hypothetical protein
VIHRIPMAQSLKAVAGGTQNKAVPVKRALLSVSDKVGDASPPTILSVLMDTARLDRTRRLGTLPGRTWRAVVVDWRIGEDNQRGWASGKWIRSLHSVANQLHLHPQVQDVSDYTEFPEMMDGRVKTLHPRVRVPSYVGYIAN